MAHLAALKLQGIGESLLMGAHKGGQLLINTMEEREETVRTALSRIKEVIRMPFRRMDLVDLPL